LGTIHTTMTWLRPRTTSDFVQGSTVVRYSVVLSESAASVPFFQPTILSGFRFVTLNATLSWLVNGVENTFVGTSGQAANIALQLNQAYLANQAQYVADGEEIHVTPKFTLSQLDTLTGGASEGHYKTLTEESVVIVKLD